LIGVLYFRLELIFYCENKDLFSYSSIIYIKLLMTRKFFDTCIFTILLMTFISVQAQKDQIPIEPVLEQNSERMLIKIGMIKKNEPAKLKFGNYTTDSRSGKGEKKNSADPGDTKNKEAPSLLFSFDVLDNSGGVAKVEASSGRELESVRDNAVLQNEISIYVTTNLDEEDLWILLMTKDEGTQEFSLKNVFLTNGTEEITFKNVIGEPTGNSEFTAPKGIEAFYEEISIGAMQYYSGGSFSYKKFIWISDKESPQLKLVTAAVFSAMMEVGNYFEDSSFTE